ncbi:MAG: NTP transferase domain-containing protein [Candidatus Omnitrophica bacterium]|nr:NTP transferase domain-containing protein [Candidatus Omnitrophota bacterium]
MKNTIAVILAAGKSTRMHSSFSKVLHKIYGKSMLEYVFDDIRAIGINKGVVITSRSNGIEKKISMPKGFRFAFQDKMLGTGHALKQAVKALSRFSGDILVLYGDTPLVTKDTLRKLIEKHKLNGAACTLLTTTMKNPSGYGRIVRDEKKDVLRIVEDADASLYERMIDEINVGVYCFKAKEVFKALELLRPKGPKKEYYLTDAVEILSRRKLKIDSIQTDDSDEALGVNSRMDLARAQTLTKNRILTDFMHQGVGIIDPSTTHIYNDVKIGQDTIIYPFTVIESGVRIGKHCKIGPFARLRPGTVLEDAVEIGNYVEIVRSRIGSGTKVKHKCYIADARIKKNINIDAGVIITKETNKNAKR